MSDQADQAAEHTILYAVDGPIATITFNRPDRLNALVGDMTNRYVAALQRADADPAVRVVVVTGAGRGFCAGADFSRLESLTGEGVRQRAREAPRDAAVRISKPVIAAVNGAVAGAGLAHALMADVRFTVPDAKWTTTIAKLGLAAELNLSWTLTQLVGTGRALDLLLSARVISGTQAHDYGLAQFLTEPQSLQDDVRQYALQVAANSAHALDQLRQQVRLDAARSFDEAWADGYERVYTAIDHGGTYREARERARRSDARDR
ncbi:enoyl-CoA hydratase-related protein [Polymorphospora sp. A560]